MNFRYIFLIVILCFQSVLYAQRERVQTFDASGIEFIQLQVDEVFKIEVETKASAENIKNETLTANLELAEALDNGVEISFDDVNTQLSINKH